MTATAAEFAQIVRSHQAMVYSIARHFDPHTAEELAQDVFLQLHRHFGSIESPAHLTNWLRRVATQRAIDQTRRNKLRPRVGLESVNEPSQLPDTGDPFMSEMLHRLVQGLPERPRMLVILRYQEDLEPGEIAGILQIPIGTVKSGLHRALAVLRGRLEQVQKGALRQ